MEQNTSPRRPITLGVIASALGQPAPAQAEMEILGINSLTDAHVGEISFLASDQFLKQALASHASALLVGKKINLTPEIKAIAIRVDNVDLAMVKVLQLFAPAIPKPAPGIHSSARISSDVLISPDSSIGAFVSIGRNSKIGNRCVLHPGVVIGEDVTIGDDCVFHANVVVRDRITIGNRVVIHAGSVLGTDGFGYAWDGSQHVKIPQIGTVIIEDDVELGSCTCIDRAKFGATVIGHGTKIDNLVQIAHNVKIGPNCIMAGQVGIAGSSTLGAGVIVGGAASIRDHVSIGDGAMIAARSGVIEDIPARSIYSGAPALPHRQSLREQAAFRKLPELIVQLRKLQEQLNPLLKNSGIQYEDLLGE
jgi:UDP-3-O-[3-hydroxymyristoyl] glucosamine N-acyltransferase